MVWADAGVNFIPYLLAAGSLASLGLVALLRRALCWPGSGSETENLDLHPYEMAAVRNGPAQPINVALTRMVHDGILAFNAREWTLAPRRALPADARPLERAIYTAVTADPEGGRFDAALIALLRDGALALTAGGRRLRPGGKAPEADRPLEQAVYAAALARPAADVSDLRAAVAALPAARDIALTEPPGRYIEEVRRAAAGEAAALHRILEARRLVVSEARFTRTSMGLGMLGMALTTPPFLCVASWADQDKRLGLVAFLMMAVLAGAIVLGFVPIEKTRRGGRVFARLKKAHAATRKQWRTGRELAISLGLFGPDSLRGSELAALHSSQPALTRLWRWLRTRRKYL